MRTPWFLAFHDGRSATVTAVPANSGASAPVPAAPLACPLTDRCEKQGWADAGASIAAPMLPSNDRSVRVPSSANLYLVLSHASCQPANRARALKTRSCDDRGPRVAVALGGCAQILSCRPGFSSCVTVPMFAATRYRAAGP